jgi:hypothetical protein
VRTWEQEHLALLDRNVTKVTIIHDTKEHIALILVEPFLLTAERVSSKIHLNESLGVRHLGFVDMVVCARIWSADSHDYEVCTRIEAEVVYRWTQAIGVLPKPTRKIKRC